MCKHRDNLTSQYCHCEDFGDCHEKRSFPRNDTRGEGLSKICGNLILKLPPISLREIGGSSVILRGRRVSRPKAGIQGKKVKNLWQSHKIHCVILSGASFTSEVERSWYYSVKLKTKILRLHFVSLRMTMNLRITNKICQKAEK